LLSLLTTYASYTGGKITNGIVAIDIDLRKYYTAGVNKICGRFAPGIKDTGGKIAAGVVDTGGNP
jgi:hypothetical protein